MDGPGLDGAGYRNHTEASITGYKGKETEESQKTIPNLALQPGDITRVPQFYLSVLRLLFIPHSLLLLDLANMQHEAVTDRIFSCISVAFRLNFHLSEKE